MIQANSPADFAAKARVDRARQIAQRTDLRRRTASNYENYVREFERRRWRFGRDRAPRRAGAVGFAGRGFAKIAASLLYLFVVPWIVTRTLFQLTASVVVSLPWFVTCKLAQLALSLLLVLPWVLTRKALIALIPLLAAFPWLLPSASEAVARQLVLAALWATEPLFHGSQYVGVVTRRADCAQQLTIVDADGKLVATVPRIDCAEAERPHFRSLPVSPQVAASLRSAFEALEGQYHVGPRTILGLNWWGWAAAGQSYVFGDGGRGGGSSPIETATKNVVDKGGRLTLRGKLMSGMLTAAITSHIHTAAERDFWVATNTPCARGAVESRFGPPAAGGFCTQILFGQDNLVELTPAQACTWAATSLMQALIPGEDTPEAEHANIEKYNNGIIERAERCLRKQFTQADQLKSYLKELSQIAAAAPFTLKGRRSDAPADPAQRLRARLAGSEYVVADQLRLERFSQDSEVRLTLSSAVQQEALPAFNRALARIEAKVPELCVIGCDDPSRQVDVAVAIAELQPTALNIVAAVTNKHGLLSGRIRRDASGGFEMMPPTRGSGSLNKAFLTLPLARDGITHLCNEQYRGIKNPGTRGDTGVSSCTQPGAMIPLASIYGQSLNLPPLKFAREQGADALRDLALGLSMTLKPGIGGDDLAVGFVLGTDVVATPMTFMRNFAAIYSGGASRQPHAFAPGLVADAARGPELSLAALGYDTRVVNAASKMLQHPISHANGTLRTLVPVLSRLGCNRAIGKTGTPETEATENPKGNRDKLFLAGFRCGKRDFVVFGMIGSPDIRIPLGSVMTSDVVTLVEPILAAAIRKGARYATR